jgi:V/A-type H+-transporting ATPase subunit E
MNGIEQILDTIRNDADAQIARILSEADETVRTIESQAEAARRKQADDAEAAIAKKASSQKERLESLANLEARQIVLGAKQKCIDEAYAVALDRLKALPPEQLHALGGSPETAIRLVRERTMTDVARMLFGDLEEKK